MPAITKVVEIMIVAEATEKASLALCTADDLAPLGAKTSL